MGRHVMSGYMDRRARRQKGAARLWLQVTISTLHIGDGERVPGGTVHAHGASRRGHAAIHDPWRTIEIQHLVGGRVAAPVSPGSTFAVGVGEVPLLHDGF